MTSSAYKSYVEDIAPKNTIPALENGDRLTQNIVWRFQDRELDWFRLTFGKYILLDSNSEGIIKSEVFPGLWLDKEALLAGNLAKVIEIVQQGLTTVEHQNFVKQLSDSL
ncbi:hypothetical protein [Nostoc sp. WHI]|uniref:hypothetical protein n=1 Tax=Nostoc sp. WHI TaxID=2650611 RepID=UPI0018C63947|nr:hypothetical protein [Nostoc sp. WHI]MBG1269527.1 hypothetical protein [Nostoc sp. WHI]